MGLLQKREQERQRADLLKRSANRIWRSRREVERAATSGDQPSDGESSDAEGGEN